MQFRIKKVAVLGSGVMGSGIACHLANVGYEVIMLDILPPKPSNNLKSDFVYRNSVARNALDKSIKSKPSPLYKKEFAERISIGNFEDDFSKISEVDWIIEAVLEKLEIKKSIFKKVDKYRKSGTIISSNTSSIPISKLAKDRSEDFKKYFCGTHFFNPPRYLRLLEIIPIKETSPELVRFLMSFGEVNLGKQTVICKDTPAFIANRIGVMSGIKVFELTEKYEMTIEEVDLLTGVIIGRPKTGTFRLQDLVGIDTGDKVTNFVMNNVKGDTFFEKLGKDESPSFFKFLLKNNFLGDKTGKGFYEKTNKKDDSGRSVINALDLKTLRYRLSSRPKIQLIKEAKGIENMSKRFEFLISKEYRESFFLKEYFAAILSYTAHRLPEISDSLYQVDDAMRAGYFWDYGPFEYWDLIGFENAIKFINDLGLKLPDWIIYM